MLHFNRWWRGGFRIFLSRGQTTKEWHKPAFKENNEEKDVGLGNHIMRIAACFTSTPINHIVFFLFPQYTSHIRKPKVMGGGRGAYSLHPSPKSARDRPLEKPLFNKRSLSVPQEVYKKQWEESGCKAMQDDMMAMRTYNPLRRNDYWSPIRGTKVMATKKALRLILTIVVCYGLKPWM